MYYSIQTFLTMLYFAGAQCQDCQALTLQHVHHVFKSTWDWTKFKRFPKPLESAQAIKTETLTSALINFFFFFLQVFKTDVGLFLAKKKKKKKHMAHSCFKRVTQQRCSWPVERLAHVLSGPFQGPHYTEPEHVQQDGAHTWLGLSHLTRRNISSSKCASSFVVTSHCCGFEMQRKFWYVLEISLIFFSSLMYDSDERRSEAMLEQKILGVWEFWRLSSILFVKWVVRQEYESFFFIFQ